MSRTARIALVAGSLKTAQELKKQLLEYLDDIAVIDIYAVDSGINACPQGDLLLLSSELVYEELDLAGLLSDKLPIVVANRTINCDYLDELVLLPDGTEVLFVNDRPATTHAGIQALQQLGLDSIQYFPYFPTMEDYNTKVSIAVVPGDVDLVPVHIERIIDIGPRTMDFTSITKILNHLDSLDSKAGLFSQKYLAKIIKLAKRLAVSNNLIQTMNKHLGQVIDSLDDGVLVYTNAGEIAVLNDNLKDILKLNVLKAEGRFIQKLFFNERLVEFLLDRTRVEDIFTFSGKDLFISKFYIQETEEYLATFKNLEKTKAATDKLRRELLKKGFFAKYSLEHISGNSPDMLRVKEIVSKLALTELTILIQGESGTGKELFASAVHNASNRCEGPFLAVNFSALSDHLIESELFGYEDGAFTGAKKGGKAGLFELADGGTVFLDEIGDISLKVQTRLLRVLQEKELMRVGGSEIKKVDVRIIAATNSHLPDKIKQKQFREDLYFRLKMGFIHLPPLRKRKEDIPALVETFIAESQDSHVRCLDEVYAAFCQYDWYGNVRELKNTLAYMLAVRRTDVLTKGDIPHSEFFYSSQEPSAEILSNENSSRESSHLDEEHHLILGFIHNANIERREIGRNSLAELSKQSKFPMTSAQIRSRLKDLESCGLLSVQKGRKGPKLTEKGRLFLKPPK